MERSVGGRTCLQRDWFLVAGWNNGNLSGIPGRNQRSVDNSCRRWNPFVERSTASDTWFIRLSSSGSLVSRSTVACQITGESEHVCVPWKYGRYLCRYRMGSRNSGSWKVLSIPERWNGRDKSPFPGNLFFRCETCITWGHGASCTCCLPVCARPSFAFRNAGA